MNRRLWRFAGIASLCILIVLTLISCGHRAPAKPAAMLTGLETFQVPGADLKAFIYVNQGEPLLVPGDRLSLPSEVSIDSVSGWALSPETAGVAIDFTFPEEAKEAFNAVPGDVWKYLDGSRLFLVSGPETEQLGDRILSGAFVSLEEARPEIWKTMNMLPADPAYTSLATGYVVSTEELQQWLSQLVEGENLQAITVLEQLPFIDHAAFGLYAGGDIAPVDNLSLEHLEQSGVGGLIIVKFTLPSYITGPAFRTLADRLGLEQAGDDVYVTEQGGWSLVAKPQDSYVYMAFMADKDGAAQLLNSALRS